MHVRPSGHALRCWLLSLGGMSLIAAPQAHANVGLPMIVVEVPVMALSILPIILIEGWVLQVVTKASRKECFFVAKISNIVSTIVGIPLTWVALTTLQVCLGGTRIPEVDPGLTGVQAVTWQGAWLMPSRYEMRWMIPAALLFLQLPFCLVSCATEFWVSARRMKAISKSIVFRAILVGNGITYGLLMLFALGLLLTARPPATPATP